MRYACLVYQEEESLMAIPDAELEESIGECIGHVGDLEQGGQHIMSSALQSPRSATTLRRRNGRLTVTDGPFAETKEVLGGFTILEARDLNEAIQLASKFAIRNGSIEVRPLLDPAADLTDPLDIKIARCVQNAIKKAPQCQEEPATV